MGKCEVTWDEFEEYAFSKDIKRKQRENVDLSKLPATEKAADAVTRSTKPYADMTFGFGSRGNPAICMTHHAAMEYCRWLSAKTGKNYRLPTEAEWEFAARGGASTAYSFGDDAGDLGEYAWYVENAEKPMPVGKKKPNPYGLHDIHGNVMEWCLDQYSAGRLRRLRQGRPARQGAGRSCRRPRNIPTSPEGARGTTTPTSSAPPPARRPTPSGRSRIPSGRRASGGTPTPPTSASGSSGRSRSRKISRASARWL